MREGKIKWTFEIISQAIIRHLMNSFFSPILCSILLMIGKWARPFNPHLYSLIYLFRDVKWIEKWGNECEWEKIIKALYQQPENLGYCVCIFFPRGRKKREREKKSFKFFFLFIPNGAKNRVSEREKKFHWKKRSEALQNQCLKQEGVGGVERKKIRVRRRRKGREEKN